MVGIGDLYGDFKTLCKQWFYEKSEVDTALNGKQNNLISGTNIKTINNTSLLGSGNISIQGGGSVTVDSALSTTSENPVQNKVITGALNGKANSSSLSTVATSGSYNDLSNKPSIPTKTSDLNNDSGFITSSSLPTKTSDLTNDGSDGTNAFVSTNDSRLYDTGWQNLSFPTGFTHYATNQKAQYRRIGKIVHLRGAVKNTNAFTSSNDTSNHIATISDTTCRPSAQNEMSIQQGSGQNRFLLTIDPNGKLYCARYGTTSNTQVNASAWLNINCTFMVE